ncbi:mannitol dehydrogenase family protein [Rhizobium sp. SSA_523]|uniref:mannitol dehydrogenase family protein n=1 Tax=Rhizobium sp. SSA_523 TaxID=2952477 RepID=UPI002090F920|nr:mannitol dehydrogenase family protein [Rhizobium sp. SSA_523]MCO5734269.1 mannitol dehydrogenase family protein [Rhizobium sp. SSA_523]WKC21459.1 mannitol dehydrogenase family protein [Rhizobium sp. SSA_523]
MTRFLCQDAAINEGVRRPQFDRQALKPGIVHIGLGAFNRAHQAVFTQRALETAFGPWGIIAVNLRSPEPVEALNAQDGLYSITVRSEAGDQSEIIGATLEGICAATDGPRVLDSLAHPDIRIVTMTVSEKAYGLDPVTGGLDLAHPAVAADLQTPETPSGVLGFIVEGLSRRRQAGLKPFTVLCCDNLPSNGTVIRRLVLDMAQRRDPALAAWVAEHGAFPCSMVDRIVPAATGETRARAVRLLGVEDRLALDTEPFIQWVIEDRFVDGRPQWEAGGAIFADNVEPYEKMKLRLLNGTHTLLAHLGILHGLDYIRETMADPALAAKARAHMEEVVETLDPVPGIDLSAYIDELLARFANPTIDHRTLQISLDTTQKLPQRLLSPAMDALSRGGDAAATAYAVGVWMAAVRRRGDCDDPRRKEVLDAAAAMDDRDPSASFFAIPGLFPPQLIAARQWRDRVNAAVTTFGG